MYTTYSHKASPSPARRTLDPRAAKRTTTYAARVVFAVTMYTRTTLDQSFRLWGVWVSEKGCRGASAPR